MTFRQLPFLVFAFLLPAALVAQEVKPAKVDLGIPAELAARKGPDGITYAEAYKRALIYGPGSIHINQRIVDILLETQLKRMKAAGMDVSRAQIAEDAISARINQKIAEFKAQQPEIDFWVAVLALGFTEAQYRSQQRVQMAVDDLFFPIDPEQWPLEILQEAFQAGDANSLWDSWVLPMHEQLKSAAPEERSRPSDDSMYQMILRPAVMHHLLTLSTVEEPFHGLPEGICLRVDGRDIPTDAMYTQIAHLIGPVEKERATTWVDLNWAVQKSLAESDILLSREEVLAMIADEMKEYEGSPISYEQVVLQYLGFPSMQAWREFFRMRMSFRRSLPDPFPDDMMREHYRQRRSFLADGKVEAEVIMFSAQDLLTRTFPRSGDPFGDARKRADAAAAELAADASWSSVLVKYSDYPDTYPGAYAEQPQPRNGRFEMLGLNPLGEFLGESQYVNFLTGKSLAEHMFFRAEEGTIYGPAQGAIGWFIYKVNRREQGNRELDPEGSERQAFLIGDDLLNVRFNAFVDGVMGK
ncbi:MAG TPA: hypothetical protein VGC54_05450 [Planctomycetota bacterium]